MDEQRLAEIDKHVQFLIEQKLGPIIMRRYLTDLIAEIRCLRRENLLLNLSRGTPSVVGMD